MLKIYIFTEEGNELELETNVSNHIVLNRNCDAVDLAPSEDF